MAYPQTNIPLVIPGQYIDEDDYNELVSGLNFQANVPACRVFHNANQSIAHNSAVTVAFNSKSFDTDTMHNTVTNNSRITINTAGIYIVSFTGYIDSGGDYTEIYADFYKNGALASTGQSVGGYTLAGGAPRMHNATILKLAATDYLEVKVFHVNGAAVARNLLTDATALLPSFSAVWAGRG